MASWMVHLRIADKLLDRIPGLSPIEFIIGNMAPDSGVPNEDWSVFTPSTTVSHFKSEKSSLSNRVYVPGFVEKYFTPELQSSYNERQFAFYLGYLCHLITDCLWVEQVYDVAFRRFPEEAAGDKKAFVERMKEDWYDLDFKYLRDRPGFRAFRAYLGSVGFRNEFMEEFAEDAFDNRRQYITGFYLEGKDGLDREYPYLTEAEMDSFVTSASEEILNRLKTYVKI